MARMCRIGRRKVVVAVVCMWSSILQQYACLLMDVYMLMLRLRGASTQRGLPEHRIPLPLSRVIYRIGFLAYTTRTTDISCINLLRMKRSIFWSLCELLRDKGGLIKSNNMSVDEMLAIFLVTVGHNTKNRTVQALFHRSAETISRTIRKVLLAILKLHDILIEKPVPVPENCTDGRWKHFKGCIGALDGTIIKVNVTKDAQPRYRTRKGDTGINVLAACNQNMQFLYCLAGWEGSAHDSRVLRDALSRVNGLRVPAGKYFLCDAGYANAKGFLTPFRGQRYHLREWGTNRPRSPEEYYNMKHSGARNVIERAFGILKMRWAILRDSSWFSPRMVGMLMNACCLLHNYIRREGGPDIFELAYVPPPNDYSGYAAEDITFVTSVEPTAEWTSFRAALAQDMWENRANRV